MREGEQRQTLVRREHPGGQTLRVLRPTASWPLGDGSTAYYTSGARVAVVMPPSRLALWYQRANEWARKLIEFIETLEGGPSGSRQQGDIVDEVILQTPGRVVQGLYLARKAGHVMVLAGWVAMYVLYERVKHLAGLH